MYIEEINFKIKELQKLKRQKLIEKSKTYKYDMLLSNDRIEENNRILKDCLEIYQKREKKW